MKTVWTKGLTGDAKADIVSAYKHSPLLRGRLKGILEDKVQTEVKARYSRDDYESPNWDKKQADSIGYMRALREIITLISD